MPGATSASRPSRRTSSTPAGLSEEKGILEFVEATEGLPRVIVGDGPLRAAGSRGGRVRPAVRARRVLRAGGGRLRPVAARGVRHHRARGDGVRPAGRRDARRRARRPRRDGDRAARRRATQLRCGTARAGCSATPSCAAASVRRRRAAMPSVTSPGSVVRALADVYRRASTPDAPATLGAVLALKIVFWTSLAALVWTHVAYPPRRRARARLRRRACARRDIEPTVARRSSPPTTRRT